MNAENRKPQRGLKNVKVNQSGVMFCALDAYCSQDFVSINIEKSRKILNASHSSYSKSILASKLLFTAHINSHTLDLYFPNS